MEPSEHQNHPNRQIKMQMEIGPTHSQQQHTSVDAVLASIPPTEEIAVPMAEEDKQAQLRAMYLAGFQAAQNVSQSTLRKSYENTIHQSSSSSTSVAAAERPLQPPSALHTSMASTTTTPKSVVNHARGASTTLPTVVPHLTYGASVHQDSEEVNSFRRDRRTAILAGVRAEKAKENGILLNMMADAATARLLNGVTDVDTTTLPEGPLLERSELPHDCGIVIGSRRRGDPPGITSQYRGIRSQLTRRRNRRASELQHDIYLPLLRLLQPMGITQLQFFVEEGVSTDNGSQRILYRKLNDYERDFAVLNDVRNNASPKKTEIKGTLTLNHKRKEATSTMDCSVTSIIALASHKEGESTDDEENTKKRKNDQDVDHGMTTDSEDSDSDDSGSYDSDFTFLSVACRNGDYDSVVSNPRLISEIRTRDNDGRNLMHYTCAGEPVLVGNGNHFRICKFIRFTTNFRDIFNARDILGRTPYLYACAYGHLDIVRDFYQAADIVPDNDGRLPLHMACQEGHIRIVKFLLQHCTQDILARDCHGKTFLHYAVCGSNSMDSCMFRETWPTEASMFKTNPKRFRNSKCRRCQVVRLLVGTESATGLISACDHNGCTALHYACNGGSSHFKDYDSNTKPSAASHQDCGQCFRRIFVMLVDKGANIEQKDNHGRTPVHYAAKRGNLLLVELIHKWYADVNARTNDGLVALHFASQLGRYSIVEYLLKYGKAGVDAPANNGMTALHFACRNGRLEVARYLFLHHNASANAVDKDGKTALHFACEYGHSEIVKFLLHMKADVNATSHLGWTSLHFSSSKGSIEIVKLLVISRKCQINVDAKTVDGKTAVHLARENGFSAIVEYIEGPKERTLDDELFRFWID